MIERREDLERAKDGSWAETLLRAGRRMNAHTLSKLEKLGLRIRPAHTALFPHIDLVEGTRPSELAKRMGISKQAVGQLVEDLVSQGMLEKRSDPGDGRAYRVCFSRQEGRTVLDGLRWLGEAEAELEARLGASDVRELRRILGRLLEALDDLGAES
ncbi:MAG: MarR family transcriptional regulator [Myxococcota bacterium]